MSLPVYFAVFSEQETPAHVDKTAGIGCTFDLRARRTIWERPFPADLLTVDDRAVPQADEPAPYVSSLLEYLGNATEILLDFERPRNPFCAQFLVLLQSRLPSGVRLIVPPQYSALCTRGLILVSSGIPCNHWETFCARQHRQYGERWCLELVPWSYVIRENRRARCPPEKIPAAIDAVLCQSALCRLGRREDAYYLFDTGGTLRQKCRLAQKYGCQLAVGLAQELEPYS